MSIISLCKLTPLCVNNCVNSQRKRGRRPHTHTPPTTTTTTTTTHTHTHKSQDPCFHPPVLIQLHCLPFLAGWSGPHPFERDTSGTAAAILDSYMSGNARSGPGLLGQVFGLSEYHVLVRHLWRFVCELSQNDSYRLRQQRARFFVDRHHEEVGPAGLRSCTMRSHPQHRNKPVRLAENLEEEPAFLFLLSNSHSHLVHACKKIQNEDIYMLRETVLL